MKEGWEIKKLGEICEVVAGQSPEGKYYNTEEKGIPFYQGKKEFTNFYLGKPKKWTTKITKEALKNDILMSVRAPVGPVNIATTNICIGRGLAAIRPNQKILRDFLFQFLIMYQPKLKGNTGAVFDSINQTQIKQIPISIPPLAEQKRIVAKLDNFFSVIERSRNNAEKNLQNAKELFESYLNKIFTNPKENWEEKKLGEVCEKIFAGGDKPQNAFSKQLTKIYNIPIYSNGEKDEGLYGFTDTAKVNTPSITVSARGTIGYSVIRYEPYFPIIRLIVLIPKTKLVSIEFLQYIVTNINFKKSGTTIPQLTVPMIKEYKGIFPPLAEQKQIVEKLDKLKQETDKLEEIYTNKIAKLDELKKSILQKAFKGEL